ncbi:hypothetical protein CP532_1598 [Ophiocordyceps camponoti-leonardi (nom. inval.)]|nr:hypothetical protein CP532_1598 [Ophiocordyceps camponoti-leonardi (nom. inval.)]
MAKNRKHRQERPATPDGDHVNPADLRDDTPKKSKGERHKIHRSLAQKSSEKKDAEKHPPPKNPPAKKEKDSKKGGKTPAKKPSGKKVTVTSISTADKKALASSGRALFLSVPKEVQPRSKSQISALKACVTKSRAAKGFELFMPSGSSYLAVVYSSTDTRDAAMEVLKKEKITVKGKNWTLVAAPFGEPQTTDEPQSWLIPVGPFTQPEELAKALVAMFKERNELHPGFELRRLILGGASSTFVVVWEGRVTFAKHISIDGTRLISCEPRNHCLLCGEKHRISSCTRGDTGNSLGVVEWQEPADTVQETEQDRPDTEMGGTKDPTSSEEEDEEDGEEEEEEQPLEKPKGKGKAAQNDGRPLTLEATNQRASESDTVEIPSRRSESPTTPTKPPPPQQQKRDEPDHGSHKSSRAHKRQKRKSGPKEVRGKDEE